MKNKSKDNNRIEQMENLILKTIDGTSLFESSKSISNEKTKVPRDTKDELKERILRILKESGETLTKDSIHTVICLEQLNDLHTALMNLIKKNKIKSVYIGDSDKFTRIDEFVFEIVK